MTAQPYDPGTMPFGAHDAVDQAEGDTMRDPRESAILRLQRQAIGASADEALALVDELGIDLVNSESDAQLAKRVRLAAEAGFNPSAHNIDEVKEHVGTDAELAQVMLAAELESSTPRKTLVAWLETMTSAPDNPPADGDSDGGEAGAEADDSDGALSEADSS